MATKRIAAEFKHLPRQRVTTTQTRHFQASLLFSEFGLHIQGKAARSESTEVDFEVHGLVLADV